MADNAELYLVVYRNNHVRLQALGLGVQHKDEWTVYEVLGSHPTYTRNARRGPPDDSVSDVKCIKVGEVPDENIEDIQKAFEDSEINNTDPSWSSRNFVMDILESLALDAELPSDEDNQTSDGKASP